MTRFARYTSWLRSAARRWWLLLIALGLTAIFTYTLLQREFNHDLADADRAHRMELDLLTLIIGDALRQARFDDVLTLIDSWGSRNPSVVEMRVLAANGFVLGAYHRAQSTQHRRELSSTLNYGYRETATLYIARDLDEIYATNDLLMAEMAAGLSIMGLLLGYLVYVSARRHESAEELRALTGQLEQRVQERTAELEAANRELQAFSYSVAHDLSTPLRALHGFSEVLVEDYGSRLEAEGLDHLQRIQHASKRMAQLIDDLLRLSKVSRDELQRSTVDLTALVQSAVADVRATEPERSVQVNVDAGLSTVADPALLRIALTHLVANAFKFTRQRPTAQIEFRRTEHDGETVYSIRDNGVGFDMAFADKLFKPFQRLHNIPEFEGTGIGLSIAARIVERHGGRIWAQSELDRGATFFFTLKT